MTIGTKDNFRIYEEQYYGGLYEAVAQNINVFNAASAGAIVLSARDVPGDFSRESFIRDLELVTRRDPAATSAVADAPIVQDEFISVKLSRRLGPVAQTLDAWKKINQDPQIMSYMLGQMAGQRKVRDYVNTAVLGCVTAIGGVAAMNPAVSPDSSAPATLTHAGLITAMSAFGDQSASVAAFVTHSKAYFDLLKDTVAEKIVEVAGAVIYSGNVSTFNRPTIVTDSPALVADNEGTPNYRVLALTGGAVRVEENSDSETVAFELITGLENLVYRYQGEYAYNLGLKGFAWNTTAGANPTDTAIGKAANWKKVASSDKALAGSMIVVS
ncbi:MAG: major capsid protein [Deltaproteobacteria bacterium]|jgi:hypothetical protein|nr:major capsid protein [Deltaproteobacteria bacterium]